MPLDSIQQWRARVGLYHAAYALRPRRTYSKLQWQRFEDGYLLEALFLVVVKVLLDVIYVCTTGNVVHALTCLIHKYKEWHSGSEEDIPTTKPCRHPWIQILYERYTNFWGGKGGSLLLRCALVVEMLLMLAGDVERNPGPTPLNLEHYQAVRKALLKVRPQWRNIGLALGIPHYKLKEFSGSFEERMDAMLEVWLNHNYSTPTWGALMNALRDDTVEGGKPVATEIEEKFMSVSQGGSNDEETCPEFIKRYADSLKCKYRRLQMVPDEYWRRSFCRYETQVALLEHDSEPNSNSDVPGNVILGKIDRIMRVKKCIEIPEIFSPQSNDDLKILIDGAPGVGKTALTRKFCKDWAKSRLLENYRLVVLLPLREKRVFLAKSIDDLFYHDDRKLQKQVVSYIRETQGDKVMLIFDGFDELSAVQRNEESLFLEIIRGESLQNCSVVVTSRPYASTHLQWLSCISRHIEVLGFTEEQIKNYITSNIEDKSKASNLVQALQGRQDILSLCYVPLNCAIVVFIYRCEGYVLPETLTELYQMFMVNMIKRHMEKLKMSDQVAGVRDLDKLPGDLQACLDGLSSLAYKGTLQEKSTFSLEELQAELPPTPNSLGSDIYSILLSLMTSYQSVSGYGTEENYQFVHLTIQEFLAARHASRLPIHDQIPFFSDPNWTKKGHWKVMLLFLAGITELSHPQYRDQCFSNFQLSFDDSLPLSLSRMLADTLLQFLHLFYEAQNSELCRVFSHGIKGQVIRMSGIILHPFHCKILAYFLVCSGCRWKCLDLHQCDLKDDSLQVFKAAASSGTYIHELILDEAPAALEYHNILNNKFTLAGVSMISDVNLFNRTEVLKVSCHNVVLESSPLATSGLFRILQMEHLAELHFCVKPPLISTVPTVDCMLKSELIEMPLQISGTLRTLSLVACERTIHCVVNALKASHVVNLELSFAENRDINNQQSHVDFISVLPELQLLKSLQSLTLHLLRREPLFSGTLCYCKTESELLQKLLECTQTLRALVLRSDYMSDIDIQCISKGMIANLSLNSLNIHAPSRTLMAFCPLFKALLCKQTIELLHLTPGLGNEDFPANELTCLKKVLQANKCLCSLELSYVPTFGIRHIAAGLAECPFLKELHLHSIVMPVDLGAQLLQVLLSCRTLKIMCLTDILLVNCEPPNDELQKSSEVSFGQSAKLFLLEKEMATVTLDFNSVLSGSALIVPSDPKLLPNPRPMIQPILEGIAKEYCVMFHFQGLFSNGNVVHYDFEATKCDHLEDVAGVSKASVPKTTRGSSQVNTAQGITPAEPFVPMTVRPEYYGEVLPITWDTLNSAVKNRCKEFNNPQLCPMGPLLLLFGYSLGVNLKIEKNLQIRWIHKVREGGWD